MTYQSTAVNIQQLTIILMITDDQEKSEWNKIFVHELGHLLGPPVG